MEDMYGLHMYLLKCMGSLPSFFHPFLQRDSFYDILFASKTMDKTALSQWGLPLKK